MADGEAFRQRVADVLKAAGIAVEIEAIVCGKRIDILATTSILGRDRCYAIECKASDSNIGMDTVSADAVVYNDIASNQTSGIDEAWIVGSRMFTPQARDHASNLKRLELLTYDDLMARLFDVRPYMMSLRDRHEVELSNSLYVPLRSDNGQMLDQVVKDWIDAPDRAAMAIIAGYGRGKTTFADRIAGELAAIALSDNAARVPVLLKLSEISQEARLSGLVLSTLAGPHIAQRVSFEFFTKLNGFGRFVVIADGFDEMKYGLNFEEFEFLFNQIRALVVDGAKVLLLGRPSAFLSESEELAVLSLPESEPALVSPEAVERFEEISIDLFTNAEGAEYVHAYVLNALGGKIPPEEVRSRVEDWLARVPRDLLRRPVHAWMLAVVITSPGDGPERLTLFTLYERFIRRTIKREVDKEGRDRRIGMEVRQDFARRLAWWSWTVYRRTAFPANEIPSFIFDMALSGVPVPRDTGQRELIVSGPLDRKAIGEPKLAFPHRSIQEFLVADYLLQEGFSSEAVTSQSWAFTDEVADFLTSQDDPRRLQEAFDRLIGGSYPRFHVNFIRLLAKSVAGGGVKVAPAARRLDNPQLALVEAAADGCLDFGHWTDAHLERTLAMVDPGKPRTSLIGLGLALSELASCPQPRRVHVFQETLKAARTIVQQNDLDRSARYSRQFSKLERDRPAVAGLLRAIGAHPTKAGWIRLDGSAMLNETVAGWKFAIDGLPAGRKIYLTMTPKALARELKWDFANYDVQAAIEFFATNELA